MAGAGTLGTGLARLVVGVSSRLAQGGGVPLIIHSSLVFLGGTLATREGRLIHVLIKVITCHQVGSPQDRVGMVLNNVLGMGPGGEQVCNSFAASLSQWGCQVSCSD